MNNKIISVRSILFGLYLFVIYFLFFLKLHASDVHDLNSVYQQYYNVKNVMKGKNTFSSGQFSDQKYMFQGSQTQNIETIEKLQVYNHDYYNPPKVQKMDLFIAAAAIVLKLECGFKKYSFESNGSYKIKLCEWFLLNILFFQQHQSVVAWYDDETIGQDHKIKYLDSMQSIFAWNGCCLFVSSNADDFNAKTIMPLCKQIADQSRLKKALSLMPYCLFFGGAVTGSFCCGILAPIWKHLSVWSTAGFTAGFAAYKLDQRGDSFLDDFYYYYLLPRFQNRLFPDQVFIKKLQKQIAEHEKCKQEYCPLLPSCSKESSDVTYPLVSHVEISDLLPDDSYNAIVTVLKKEANNVAQKKGVQLSSTFIDDYTDWTQQILRPAYGCGFWIRSIEQLNLWLCSNTKSAFFEDYSYFGLLCCCAFYEVGFLGGQFQQNDASTDAAHVSCFTENPKYKAVGEFIEKLGAYKKSIFHTQIKQIDYRNSFWPYFLGWTNAGKQYFVWNMINKKLEGYDGNITEFKRSVRNEIKKYYKLSNEDLRFRTILCGVLLNLISLLYYYDKNILFHFYESLCVWSTVGSIGLLYYLLDQPAVIFSPFPPDSFYEKP